MNIMNYTDDDTHYVDYKDYKNFEIVNKISFGLKCAVGIWIVFVNLLFLLAVSVSRRIKKKYSYWLLKNLAVSDLLVGLLVIPIAIHNDVYERWILGDKVCRVWIMADVVLCSVSLLALLTINIDRLVFVLKPITYRAMMRKCFIMAMIVVTWLMALAMIVPLTLSDQIRTEDSQCYMSMIPHYAIGSAIVCFFLPALLVFILNITILVIVCAKLQRSPQPTRIQHQNEAVPSFHVTHNAKRLSIHGDSRDGRSQLCQAALVMCIINILYLVMWGPFFAVNVFSALGWYMPSYGMMEIVLWMGYSNSGLNFLFWMIYPDLRQAVCDLFTCKCCRKDNYHADQGMFITDYTRVH